MNFVRRKEMRSEGTVSREIECSGPKKVGG